MLHKLVRLLHTLKYLQIKQFVFYVVRRCLKPASAIHNGKVELLPGFELDQPLPVTGVWQSGHQFNFLNISKTQLLQEFEWCPEDVSRLWRYNLHYFDYLREPSRSDDEKIQLLESWIASNPQGSQPGWEPFTASLRIVNWVFFLSHCPRANTPETVRSLYIQTLWLEKNDERHILANHYFENIKAWLFAGMFFLGHDAERWLSNGQRLLVEQLSVQFLDDGGHYERSPHYHGLMLENLLDLLNLSLSNSGILSAKTEADLRDTAIRGLAFLYRITMPDGSIPLLNDSAHGTAPSVDELYTYAERLFDIQRPNNSFITELIDEPASGIYGYRNNQDMLVIDCGDIGPDYQPGHTHCDFLSFELMLDEKLLFVDSGLYEYQAGEMREYVRSTAAHNTISVDGQEQSEIWGEFRVARRAKKIQAEIAFTADDFIEFSGSYTGFPRVAGGIIHQRKIGCDLRGDAAKYVIQDLVQGQGVHRVDSYLHFHPDIGLEDVGDGRWRLCREQYTVGYIVVEGVDEGRVTTRLERGWYCPEFGLKYKNSVLVMTIEEALPVELSYQIERGI
ncbi:MAG: alginate lyase family protein [Sedimenticola sp.]